MSISAKTPIHSSLAVISEAADGLTAINIVQAKKVRHALVINSQDEISGVLSERDISQLGGSSKSPVDLKKHMSTRIKIVHDETLLKDIFERVMNDQLAAVLVAADGEINDVISAEDLLKVFYRILSEAAIDRRNELIALFNRATAQDYCRHRPHFESP